MSAFVPLEWIASITAMAFILLSIIWSVPA